MLVLDPSSVEVVVQRNVRRTWCSWESGVATSARTVVVISFETPSYLGQWPFPVRTDGTGKTL